MTAEPGRSRVEPVVLSDGRDAVLRPLRAEDRPAVETLLAGTSADNLYTRFFSVGGNTVHQHLDHLFSREPSVVAYLVTVGDRAVGVADVELLDDVTAEVAFLVADDCHECGIATLLLERAARDASAAGIRWFVADVLAINHLMLQVFADIGFRVTTHREGTDVSLRMSTELSSAARAATRVRVSTAAARRVLRG